MYTINITKLIQYTIDTNFDKMYTKDMIFDICRIEVRGLFFRRRQRIWTKFSINERTGFDSMPKALKWGLIIIVCILALFAAGYFMPGWMGDFFRDAAKVGGPYGNQESSAPYMENSGGSFPWEAESGAPGENEK